MSQFIEMFGNPQNNSQGRKTVRFDDVLTLQRGHDLPEKERMSEGTIPIYGSNGFVGYHTESKAKNGIVTGRSGTIGKVYCIKGDYWPLNTSLYSIDTHGNNLTYLKYMVEAFDVSRFSNGTGVPTLNRNDIHKEMIPLVDISEQEAFEVIAHQADKSGFDGHKSQFIEMFGCLAERGALSSLCDTFIDGDWIEAKDQSGSGIRLIQTGNVGVGTFKDKGDRARYISEETFNRLNCTEVVEGDILISRLPEPVGRACIIPAGLGKSITAVDCTIIRLNDKVLPKFFVAFTNTPDYAMQIKKVLSGTTRLRVSRANLGKIQVPLPSIDKQQQFVTIAEQADKSGSVLQYRITC